MYKKPNSLPSRRISGKKITEQSTTSHWMFVSRITEIPAGRAWRRTKVKKEERERERKERAIGEKTRGACQSALAAGGAFFVHVHSTPLPPSFLAARLSPPRRLIGFFAFLGTQPPRPYPRHNSNRSSSQRPAYPFLAEWWIGFSLMNWPVLSLSPSPPIFTPD